MPIDGGQQRDLDTIQAFYDGEYYRDLPATLRGSRHHDRLAMRLGIASGTAVLDVACGTGGWLESCARRDASIAGVDLSTRAIEFCRRALPQGEFAVSPAETLPFPDASFDLVSCLGSLEHFVDPVRALDEMRRVARPDARFVILVPNAAFLTRRLGLFRGTYQVQAKEQARTLAGWHVLFDAAGLETRARWKDLHVLSRQWILRRPWALAPLRAAQAGLLALWPLAWQYQVYFLCTARRLGTGGARPPGRNPGPP